MTSFGDGLFLGLAVGAFLGFASGIMLGVLWVSREEKKYGQPKIRSNHNG